MTHKSTLVFLRSLIVTLVIVFSTTVAALAHGVQQLDNGRWWNGESFVERTMWIEEGRLRETAPAQIDEHFDLGGAWIVPPLADAHNHALADGTFETTSKEFLAEGVFFVQNPNSLRTPTAAVRGRAEAPDTVDVTYSNGCLTSSGGHPVQLYDQMAEQLEGWTPERMRGEAYFEIDDLADLDATWGAILEGRPDFIKVILERSELHAERRDDDAYYGRRGLDPDLLPEVVERARAAGLRVSVHVTSRQDFHTAVTSGADEISHLPLERLSAPDARAAAQAGVVVVTTTLSHRPTDGVDDVDALHRTNIEQLLEHGVRLALGTDSHRSVLDEADNLVRLGFDRELVLRLTVRDTARWIFPERTLGSLGDGTEASFLVLSADPTRDLAALRDIRFALKQGHPVDLEAKQLPGVAQQLAHTLMRDGADAAIAELHRLMAEEPDAWDVSEPQLNGLGYFALQHGKAEDAVRIFQLNAERFPASSNVWDSLGDGYVAVGRKREARESYEKALSIDPDAEHSREKLHNLGNEER